MEGERSKRKIGAAEADTMAVRLSLGVLDLLTLSTVLTVITMDATQMHGVGGELEYGTCFMLAMILDSYVILYTIPRSWHFPGVSSTMLLLTSRLESALILYRVSTILFRRLCDCSADTTVNTF